MEMNVDGWNPSNCVLNPLEVSALVSKDRTDRFVYIRHAFKRSSKFFAPYTFKLVSYNDVNQCYMTVSANGVTLYTPDEMVFTPLSMWSTEYKKYLGLVELRLFRLYRVWKAFYVWSKAIKTGRMSRAMRFIEENLFLCDDDLGGALLRVTGVQWDFAEANFMNISGGGDVSVFKFVEMQFAKIEEMKTEWKILRGKSVESVVDACVNSIANGGYLNNEAHESNRRFDTPGRGYSKVSFIDEARKRNKIAQLSRFIRLADYISIFLLLKLLENTYSEFLKMLTEHTKSLPDGEKFKNNEELNVANGDDKTVQVLFTISFILFIFRSGIRIIYPFFQSLHISIDVILSNDDGDVTVDPSVKIFHFIISRLQNHWEGCLREILESHATVARFESSVRSMSIDWGALKSRSSDAQRLSNVVKASLPVQNYKKKLTELLILNTNAVQLYCKRFGVIESFYKETKACPEDTMQRNKSSEMFRNWCSEFREKEEEINEVIDFQTLGMFSLLLERFRNQALSLIFDRKRVLEEVIPKIGKSKVDVLLSKILDATTYLDTDPTTADSFANYVEFIDDAHLRIDNMEGDGDYIKELYDITEEYGIPVDAEDFANYLMINVALTSFKIAVAERLKKRDELILKFNEQISNDVRKLTDDVSVINELISEPWLLDPLSDAFTCQETLKDFASKLQEYSKIVDKYQAYQKSFDLETIRLEILDHVRNEIHLRDLLWECMTSWGESTRLWYECDFGSLNTEEMASATEEHFKNVGELETGLGRRPIVLELKEKVEYIRERLPTIISLRNKHLRRRHWLEIEAILNFKFRPDTRINLTLMEGLGAFTHAQEFMNISDRATAEANQEAILNRIDDA
ncbi:dynein heavy chain 6, axonemal-like [Diachasma alloeum]|uniref:dynein heavy chain 6, axonemal-like n=1 Tax=Diachasma alloeum TaxID=454923 RepID=UPI00073834E0|nr:dynein heavy chain 6, axonemal-like [Diachasma alloeum]